MKLNTLLVLFVKIMSLYAKASLILLMASVSCSSLVA